ncbi:MAG: aspartyl/asparaginyl beta-hydroxylase domain-containing protein [Cyclobacteriaceae bacterium]
MKIAHRLSFHFDQNKLLKELKLAKQEWTLHFNTHYFGGEWSGIVLRAHNTSIEGIATGQGDASSYQDTPTLKKLHYIQEILDYFQCPITSVRLLKLTPGSVIKEHTDPDLVFWEGLVRLHIPIITNDQVRFIVDGEDLMMLPGECWFAEFCQPHSVENKGETDRIHLVIDLETNDWLKALFEKEGIVSANESKPDPIDSFSLEQKLEMIRSFKQMGTPDTLEMANEMIRKYGIESPLE